jgi:hypothetical protein
MAKRNSTRRKARKPKLINVEGHQLTEAMYAEYERCLESRGRTNAGADAETILYLGLDDFLARYRPSNKVKAQLSELSRTTMHAALAVGTMDKYTWFQSNPASVRSAGCKLLKELALEIYNASAKLTAIALNVEREETTKLQDWLAQGEQVARIGRGAEVVHGNR